MQHFRRDHRVAFGVEHHGTGLPGPDQMQIDQPAFDVTKLRALQVDEIDLNAIRAKRIAETV